MTKHFIPLKSDARGGPLRQLRRFFRDHGDALVNAAYLLGGDRAGRGTLRLLITVAAAERLTRSLKSEIVHLHRALLLDAPDGEFAHEGGVVPMLDACDPRVEDLCRLADALSNLLEDLEAARHDLALEVAHAG